MAVGRDEVHVAVVKFDSSNRIGRFGVPCVLLFTGGVQCVVTTHKETKRQHWAKVKVTGGDPAEMLTGELVELLGPVGVFETELYAFQLHFGILPCRYPKMETWKLLAPLDPDTVDPARGRQDCTHLHVLSIDNASTRDIDDALSFEFSGPGDAATCRIGIHVADVAARVPVSSPLFEWAQHRASSAYYHAPDDSVGGGGSVPMLPPELAHGALSLNENQPRPAVTLWLHVEMGCIVRREHARTLVTNKCATTYSLFAGDEEPSTARARSLLQMLSGASLAEDLVAWTMVEYNSYFGAQIAERAAAAAAAGNGASGVQGLLRVQADADAAAVYAIAQSTEENGSGGQGHAKLGLETYTHMSSPIRRFCDLYNQHVLFAPAAAITHPVLSLLATQYVSSCRQGLRCGGTESTASHSIVSELMGTQLSRSRRMHGEGLVYLGSPSKDQRPRRCTKSSWGRRRLPK